MAIEANGRVLLSLLRHDAAARHHQGRAQEMSEHRRSLGGNLVVNEGHHQPSPPCSHLRLVRPKKEKEPATLPVVVKQENAEMPADLDIVLKWSRDDYVRKEMERQPCALEEIAAQRCGREEGDVIVLVDNDEETMAQTAFVHSGYLGQGCSKDDAQDVERIRTSTAATMMMTTATTTPPSTSSST
ncbi:putative WRKY transcription factor 35 [Hordeum vulgare]|nr:putative WRKY transcription factor 35 [Hordeum vulgare]